MAADPLLFMRLGRPIPETRMHIADVERLEPRGNRFGQLKGTAPFAQPQTLLLELRMLRSVSALPFGLLSLVKACVMPSWPHTARKRTEVG